MRLQFAVIAAGLVGTAFWFWVCLSQPAAALIGNAVMWLAIVAWANLWWARR